MRCGLRCGRLVVRRLGGVSIGSGSGRGSLVGCRARMPVWRLVCRLRLVRVGSASMAGWPRSFSFRCRATAQLCRAYGIAQSVGRTGVCWDNAAAESFLGTLKKELVNRNDYRTRHHARLSIRWWIEAWYNPRRLHSTIGQPATKRMGGQLLPSHGRINQVSSTRGNSSVWPGRGGVWLWLWVPVVAVGWFWTRLIGRVCGCGYG